MKFILNLITYIFIMTGIARSAYAFTSPPPPPPAQNYAMSIIQ